MDEHFVSIDAAGEAAWDALLHVVERSFSSPRSARAARVLGCRDAAASGPRPLTEGSAMPGFRVAVADAQRELALAGRHRFSGYALVFRVELVERSGPVEDTGPVGHSGGVRLSAATRADFPGVPGKLYRALVIGTGLHVRVVQRILAATKRRAERA